jgi:hypothetical protein
MRAIVNINHRDMKGRDHKVHEIIGNHITLECVLEHETILVDFILREVQLLVQNDEVQVFRNQGHRDGYFVDYSSKHGYVIEYSMPNGSTFRNVVKNPFDTDNYSSISDKDYTKKFTNKN